MVFESPRLLRNAIRCKKASGSKFLHLFVSIVGEIARESELIRSKKPSFRDWPGSSTVKHALSVRGSVPGPIISNTVSPTARHYYDVSSQPCCPGTKPRRWAPPPTRYMLRRNTASMMEI